MKLRAKLFIATLCLILVMLAITYFLPTYLVQRDIAKTSNEIYASIIEAHKEELVNQKSWFKSEINIAEEEIKLLLLTLKEHPSLTQNLLFSEEVSNTTRWAAATEVINSSPETSILQLYSSTYEKANVIFYDRATLHNAIFVTEGEDNFIILPEKKQVYLAFALPEKEGYYVLERPIIPEKKKLAFIKKYSSWSKDLSPKSLAAEWNTKNQLLSLLAPLHVEGLTLGPQEKTIVPDGIFRLIEEQDGLAILSNEAFETTPLLDVAEHYRPLVPLEKQQHVLAVDSKGQFYLTYTTLLEDTFITAGISLTPLVSEFAMATHKLLLLTTGQNWIGVDPSGKEVDMGLIFKFIEKGDLAKEQGLVILNGQQYFFSKLQLFEDENLILYTLNPLIAGTSILDTLKNLVGALTHKILWHILIIGICIIGISIIVIYLITKSVVKPLEMFVHSTKKIAEGRYNEVTLPKLGRRKDEIALLSKAFEQMIVDMKERENIRSVLNKVISKEIADEFLNAEVHLGGEDRVVTMLFSDIRGFTKLTENLAPQKVIKALNLYMTQMAEIIESKQGIIDKFVGDEIMALFGAPVFHSDHSAQAINAGLLMLRAIEELNKQMEVLGEPSFEIGIGIHTGPVVAGNMGAENRMNYTVLGKNVNLAARLCQAAKPGQMIVSEYTYKSPNVEHQFLAQSLEPIVLKGFSEPINIYEITGLKSH